MENNKLLVFPLSAWLKTQADVEITSGESGLFRVQRSWSPMTVGYPLALVAKKKGHSYNLF